MPALDLRPSTKHKSFNALQNLTVTAAGPASVTLGNRALRAQVGVLAEDLFRIRLTRAKRFSTEPSWAVLPKQRVAPKAEVIRRAKDVTVRTARGQCRLSLVDGGWELSDQFGLRLFTAEPGATGFSGSEARVTLTLEESEGIFGLGESSGTFNKRGLTREFWNIDVGGHTRAVHAHQPNMYVSIPLGISIRHGRAAGVFWDNPGRQKWDIGQTDLHRWQMRAAGGELDLYFFLGPTCPEILERYTELTGRMPLPPRWALGYHQCRYSYQTRRRVEEIADQFRRRKIPCDAIYLDIHYMDGYRVFTFGKGFPRPARMIANLAAKGFKVVTIVDPGVKDDRRFPVLQRGIARRAFVLDPAGDKAYLGEVWPGRVRFPDFLNAGCRAWWGEEQARFQRLGVAGFWNDMNEPADFSAPGKDFPRACLHRTDNGLQRHAAVHNVYGSEMARASFAGALAAAPDQRPFVITRAGYAGLQRHALVWTGDNDSSWEHLADSVQMLLNLGLSGVAFCGADVGGFHHHTTGELLARWTQLASLTPFFRNHSNIGTIDQEPWAFGPKIEAICQQAIELRYQLLPYLSGLFREAHAQGTPIMRPLFWHYQNDPVAIAISDQFLLGADLLVAPILRPGATARSVYLPSGMWYDFWSGSAHRGGCHVLAQAPLEMLPIFVRAGAIVPMIALQQFVGERPQTAVNLHVWPGSGHQLNWSEDDGLSNAYLRGGVHERSISLHRRPRSARLCFGAAAGAFPTQVKRWRVLLRNVGRPVRPRMEDMELAAGFDHGLAFCAFEVPNRSEAFEVRWS